MRPTRTTTERRASARRGRHAETLAAIFLALKGYRTLARNFRHPLGEIDLVARRGRTLVFVEVKRRARMSDAAYATTPRQWRRIAAAAGVYVACRPRLHDLSWRFDRVLVESGWWWRRPRHDANVWRCDDAT